MNKLKVGIAGYGVVGKCRRACIDRHPDMQLVAVCDRTFTGDGVMDDGIHYCSNYKQLLKHNLSVLFVCLTNDIAPKVTIAGLEKGMHVFCEKPPGRDVTDIVSVIEVEQKFPELKLMYGFNHRYHESVRDALSIIRTDELGQVLHLRGVYGKSQLITFNQSDWRTKREVAGGGVLLDQGIHMVDLMRLFAGDFNEVYSIISNNYWGYDVEDNAYALMRTQDGVVGMLNSSATQWRHLFHLDINLERGSMVLGGILSGSKSYGAETLTVTNADPEKDFGNPTERTTKYSKDTSWDEEIQVFAECILNNKKVASGSSNDALKTMKLVYQIYYADPQWRKTYAIPEPR